MLALAVELLREVAQLSGGLARLLGKREFVASAPAVCIADDCFVRRKGICANTHDIDFKKFLYFIKNYF